MKTDKLLKNGMATATALTLAVGLTGCGTSKTASPQPSHTSQASQTSNVTRPAEPKDKSCDDWDWNKSKGVYECDDHSSSHYGNYYYGGGYYNSASALRNSSNYKTYRASNNFAGTTSSSSNTKTISTSSKSSSSGKTGIGSGSRGGFGG